MATICALSICKLCFNVAVGVVLKLQFIFSQLWGDYLNTCALYVLKSELEGNKCSEVKQCVYLCLA